MLFSCFFNERRGGALVPHKYPKIPLYDNFEQTFVKKWVCSSNGVNPVFVEIPFNTISDVSMNT